MSTSLFSVNCDAELDVEVAPVLAVDRDLQALPRPEDVGTAGHLAAHGQGGDAAAG
jgi:hypothetical protein